MAQLLNDICDCLGNHRGALTGIRASIAPSRNALSYANRTRNADIGEALFWDVLDELKKTYPVFALQGRKYCGIPRRFKRTINVVDSSTIKLVANCLDWAKHRRRKAAAKMHLRLDLQSFLPEFVVVNPANTHDIAHAYEACAGIKSGEIVVFDKAYVDYEYLYSLDQRGVFWVTRAKDNMQYEVVGQHSEPRGQILGDVCIKLTNPKSFQMCPVVLRLVEATVEIDGMPKQMTFLTNNMQWAPSSTCDLYKSRWGIEVFFKEMRSITADFRNYGMVMIDFFMFK